MIITMRINNLNNNHKSYFICITLEVHHLKNGQGVNNRLVV
jgi:hypothetical protein